MTSHLHYSFFSSLFSTFPWSAPLFFPLSLITFYSFYLLLLLFFDTFPSHLLLHIHFPLIFSFFYLLLYFTSLYFIISNFTFSFTSFHPSQVSHSSWSCPYWRSFSYPSLQPFHPFSVHLLSHTLPLTLPLHPSSSSHPPPSFPLSPILLLFTAFSIQPHHLAFSTHAFIPSSTLLHPPLLPTPVPPLLPPPPPLPFTNLPAKCMGEQYLISWPNFHFNFHQSPSERGSCGSLQLTLKKKMKKKNPV